MLEYKFANDIRELFLMGQFDEATELSKKAVQIMPHDPGAWELYAASLGQAGRADLAWPVFQEALKHVGHLPPIKKRGLILHQMLCYDFLTSGTAEGAKALRDEWVANYDGPIAPRQQPRQPDPTKKLRVGITSPDFRQTSAYCCFLGLFYWPCDDMEFFAYSDVTPDAVDRYTVGTMQWLGDHYRDTRGMSTDDWCALVRKDEIDVLIDCGGYTPDNRLVALMDRPAPVQLGYAPGVVLPTHDFILGDWTLDGLIPEDRIARMPALIGYEPMKYHDPYERKTGEPFTFGYTGRPIKLNQDTFAMWREILKATPESRLLLAHSMYYLVPSTKRYVEQQFPDIDPSRILIEPIERHETYNQNFSRIDLFLDSWPQNGGMTNIEALLNGCPFLTLQGETIVSKTGASLLTVLGLPELIAKSPEEYITTAIKAVHEPEFRTWLGELRKTLPQATRSSPFYGRRYAEAYRQAIRECWQKACQW